jgi:hypothetical protein
MYLTSPGKRLVLPLVEVVVQLLVQLELPEVHVLRAK